MKKTTINQESMEKAVLLKLCDCLKSNKWQIYLKKRGNCGRVAEKGRCSIIIGLCDTQYSGRLDNCIPFIVPKFQYENPSIRSWHIEDEEGINILASGELPIEKLYHEDLDDLFERYAMDENKVTAEELAIIKAYDCLIREFESIAKSALPTTNEDESSNVKRSYRGLVITEKPIEYEGEIYNIEVQVPKALLKQFIAYTEEWLESSYYLEHELRHGRELRQFVKQYHQGQPVLYGEWEADYLFMRFMCIKKRRIIEDLKGYANTYYYRIK